jgi:hypothetical protein
MSISKQVTIDRDKVMCDCGFYDKSLTPIELARSHNTRDHKGNYTVYDAVKGLIDQLTGKPFDEEK